MAKQVGPLICGAGSTGVIVMEGQPNPRHVDTVPGTRKVRDPANPATVRDARAHFVITGMQETGADGVTRTTLAQGARGKRADVTAALDGNELNRQWFMSWLGGSAHAEDDDRMLPAAGERATSTDPDEYVFNLCGATGEPVAIWLAKQRAAVVPNLYAVFHAIAKVPPKAKNVPLLTELARGTVADVTALVEHGVPAKGGTSTHFAGRLVLWV